MPSAVPRLISSALQLKPVLVLMLSYKVMPAEGFTILQWRDAVHIFMHTRAMIDACKVIVVLEVI